jgi:hypothetical protein
MLLDDVGIRAVLGWMGTVLVDMGSRAVLADMESRAMLGDVGRKAVLGWCGE